MFDGGLIVDLVEDTVDERERVDARASLPERQLGRRIAEVVGLQAEQAHHHLQIVLHAVMDFLDQNRLLRHRIAQRAVAILDGGCHFGQVHRPRCGIRWARRQAQVERHNAPSDRPRKCGADR